MDKIYDGHICNYSIFIKKHPNFYIMYLVTTWMKTDIMDSKIT